jgi:O-antigen/teichoic acid export membrane protein
MVIALYTSRIVLKALGVEDFGLYNVIGGVVALFSFLRSSMEQATQRFLNFEMGKPDGDLSKVFRVSLTIHVLFAALALLLGETVGLLLVNKVIAIPEGRVLAANVVFQCVLFSLCTTVITVPFSATVIAHEQMAFYAVVNILDACLKLGIAFVVLASPPDKLILYGILMMLISVVNILLYNVYCKKKFQEVRVKLLFDKSLFKQIFGFTSWTIIGQAATIGTNQGNNILINMFHGVTANAAMGIGNQVGSAVLNLSGSFQTAFTPQITKSYASKDFDYLRFLLFTVSKLTFILMFIVSLPIIINMDFLLGVWLEEVPVGAALFSILWIIQSIINSLSTPLNFCVNASGNIKHNQITCSLVYLSDLIVLFALFRLGLPPITAMAVKIYVVITALFIRLHYACRCIPGLNLSIYLKRVLLPLIFTTVLCVVFTYFMINIVSEGINIWLKTALIIIVSCLCTLFVSLDKRERGVILSMLQKLTHKKNNV